MPYRNQDKERAATSHEGIVGDLVAQFADPYAFYRELIQNAIDAGATRIHVSIAFSEGEMSVAVRDDGEGMTREVLQEQLLVLFRSGKEDQPDKIGKFGVGFISVMALKPSLVKIQTSRGGGRGHTVHLTPDHQYELFEHSGKRAGTTVTLVVPSSKRKVSKHITASRRSLEKWCRHAQVPILLQLDDSVPRGGGEPEAVNEPLGLPGSSLALVDHSPDGSTTIAVGFAQGEQGTLGFYNHGLTLHEIESGPFPGLDIKIQDTELEHTLSRDNVRRDAAYTRVMKRAQRIVRRAFAIKATAALRAAPTLAAYKSLLTAYVRTPLPLRGLPLRLLHEADGTWTTRLEAGTYYSASKADLLTKAVSRERPVLDARAIAAVVPRLPSVRVTLADDWQDAMHAVREVVQTHSDAVLVTAALDLVRQQHRAPAHARLADVHGRRRSMVFAADPGEGARRGGRPFALLPFLRANLVWNTANEIVAAARVIHEAADDADSLPATHAQRELASHLLARATLVASGGQRAKKSEALLMEALTGLLGDAPVPQDGETR